MDHFVALTAALQRTCPQMELRQEERMSGHTSFRIGGPVRLMALPQSEAELQLAVWTAGQFELPWLLMGNGSNLLVSDQALPLFIIKTFDGVGKITRVCETELRVESGVLLSRLAAYALQYSLTGLEFAQGIPGTVGGALVMNAGAYGGEMKQVVAETVCLDERGAEVHISGEEHRFSYRHSILSEKKYAILNSRIRLKQGDRKTMQLYMEKLTAKRKESQPLEYPSAGSVFKRPEGFYAAALIEECGLKGRTIGGAQVSKKHAGFIINLGGASFTDVCQLIETVRDVVYRNTGVSLEPELKIISSEGQKKEL